MKPIAKFVAVGLADHDRAPLPGASTTVGVVHGGV
jgi:hypothetical protein